MAVEAAPSFASATIAGLTVKTSTTSSALGANTNSLAGALIPVNTDNINAKKFVIGMDVKVGFSDVAATLILQVSHNGLDWATHQTLSADTTPNDTGVKIFIGDTTDLYAPYYRLHFNAGALNVGTSGTLQFFYAFN